MLIVRAPAVLPPHIPPTRQLDAYAEVVLGEVTEELNGNRIDIRNRQTNLGTVACKCAPGLGSVCLSVSVADRGAR